MKLYALNLCFLTSFHWCVNLPNILNEIIKKYRQILILKYTVNIGFRNHPPSEGSRFLNPARPLNQGSGYSNQVVTKSRVCGWKDVDLIIRSNVVEEDDDDLNEGFCHYSIVDE